MPTENPLFPLLRKAVDVLTEIRDSQQIVSLWARERAAEAVSEIIAEMAKVQDKDFAL